MKKIVAILAVFTLLLSMGVFAWADGGCEPGGIDLECRRVESAGDEAFVDVDVVIGSYLIGGLEMLDISVGGKLIAPEDAILINNKVFVREVGVTDESKWCDIHERASIGPMNDGRTYSVSWSENPDCGNYSALYNALFKWSLDRSADGSGGPVQVELVIRTRFLVKDPGIIRFSIQDMEVKGNWGDVNINEECALETCKIVSPYFVGLCIISILFLLGLVGLVVCMIFTARKEIGSGNSYCCREKEKEESERAKKRKYKRECKRQLEKNSDFVPF